MNNRFLLFFVFMFIGCSTSVSYRSLINEMQAKDWLSKEQYKELKDNFSYVIEPHFYSYWAEQVKNTQGKCRIIREDIFKNPKILEYLNSKKEGSPDVVVNCKQLLVGLRKDKLISDKDFELEFKSVEDREEGYVKNKNYSEILAEVGRYKYDMSLSEEVRGGFYRIDTYLRRKWSQQKKGMKNFGVFMSALGGSMQGVSSAYSAPYKQNNSLVNKSQDFPNKASIYNPRTNSYSYIEDKQVFNPKEGSYSEINGNEIYNPKTGQHSTIQGNEIYDHSTGEVSSMGN